MKVFLSCVSAEFRSYRLRLANQLGALRGEPVEVVVQEDFQQGGYELLRSLADYIRDCDKVVHLVGDAAGACPSPEHERALLDYLGDPASEPTPGISYTQWEYRLARRFGKPVLVYRATAEAPRDKLVPLDDLQRTHIAAMETAGEHRTEMVSAFQLVREVCRDLGRIGDLRIDNLPYDSIGSLFKGREEFMEKLRKVLGGIEFQGHARVAAITSTSAKATLHGLGGVGKTRAAIEYGRRHAQEFTALLFVRADSVSSLQDNLAALCGPAVFDLPHQHEKETATKVAAALRWLRAHPGWFLVFDNVDTEEAAEEVEVLLGRLGSSGQVIITTRISQWRPDLNPLEVLSLDLSPATSFLRGRTQRGRVKGNDDEASAGSLATLLGNLPLALEQAGAKIDEDRITFDQYIARWRELDSQVLDWFDKRQMKYDRSVATTWLVTFRGLSADAQRLLGLLAWLSPAPIPASLLAVPLATGSPTPDELSEALDQLRRYSLAQFSAPADAPQFSVHTVVQDVVRLHQGTDIESLRVSLEWINAAFVGDPQDVRVWPVLDPLVQHAVVCTERADAHGIAEPTAGLMNNLGLLLHAKARLREAEPLMHRAIQMFDEALGPYHRHGAAALNNLAMLLLATNRLSEAEQTMLRALAIGETACGKDHPDVARLLINLAQLLMTTNRPAGAEPLMRRALAIDEGSYGKDHPEVGADLNNLAQLLLMTNRVAEAEQLMRRALAVSEASYGKDHPGVALALNNLGQLLRMTNRFAEAEPLMGRAVRVLEDSLGADHPSVAMALNNLAELLQATNRSAGAEPLIRRALAIDEATYGKDHPDVARDLSTLATVLLATNRLAEAEPLMRSVVQTFEVSLGEDHPRVGTALNNLAQLLRATNRLGEAEPLMRRALAINEVSCGTDHPDVATALNNLGSLLHATNRHAEAEPMMRRALAIDEASYGKDHPNVARELNNLAQLLQDTNRRAEAETLMNRALAIDEASYGKDHPDVARDLSNLAGLLLESNRPAEAELLMRSALAIDEAAYGKDHPIVARDLNNLGQVLRSNERLQEAEQCLRRAVMVFFRFEQVNGHVHPDLSTAVPNFARLMMEMGYSRGEADTAVRDMFNEVTAEGRC